MPKRIDLKTNSILIGLAIIALGAALHVYQLVLEARALESASPFLTNTFFAWLQIVLLFALLLAAAGLVMRTRGGLVCSVMGLIGVLLGYLWWFGFSYRNLHLFDDDPIYTQHPELVPPSSFGLIGARWWDLVLLILFIGLLVWEIKMLVTRIKTRNHEV